MILAAGAHGTQRLTLCLRYWAWVLRSYLNCLEARGQTNIRAHSLHLLSCLHRSQKRKTPTLGLTRLPMELICDISKPNTPRGGAKKKKKALSYSAQNFIAGPKVWSQRAYKFKCGTILRQTAPPMSFQELSKVADLPLIPIPTASHMLTQTLPNPYPLC